MLAASVAPRLALLRGIYLAQAHDDGLLIALHVASGGDGVAICNCDHNTEQESWAHSATAIRSSVIRHLSLDDSMTLP